MKTRDPQRPTKLLVAYREDTARALKRALDLDHEIWLPIGFGGMLAGQRFDQIVVIVSSEMKEDPRSLDFIEHLNTKVAIGGKMLMA